MRFKIIFGASLIIFMTSYLSGCVRVVGGAGVRYQGTQDEEPKTRSVTLDTQNLIPGTLQAEPKLEIESD